MAACMMVKRKCRIFHVDDGDYLVWLTLRARQIWIRPPLLVNVDCPNLTITGSALEMSQGDNIALGNLDVGWFDGYLAGDFHLSGTHPAAINTAATWQTGDARPDSDGAADVAGADVP